MSEILHTTQTECGLVLEPFTVDHVRAVFDLIDTSRDHLSQFRNITSAKYPNLQSVHDSVTKPRDELKDRFVILDEDEVVGSVNARPTASEHEQYEIGYWIGAMHVGKGYATCAVKGLVRSIHETGVDNIIAKTHRDNLASRKVLKKAGFAVVRYTRKGDAFWQWRPSSLAETQAIPE